MKYLRENDQVLTLKHFLHILQNLPMQNSHSYHRNFDSINQPSKHAGFLTVNRIFFQ